MCNINISFSVGDSEYGHDVSYFNLCHSQFKENVYISGTQFNGTELQLVNNLAQVYSLSVTVLNLLKFTQE